MKSHVARLIPGCKISLKSTRPRRMSGAAGRSPDQGKGGAGHFFNFRRMKRILRYILPAILCLSALGGCMKWDYGHTEEFAATGRGLFITNEGNFQYGNATLSYYDPATKKVENEVFYRANAMKLGDVAQSMTTHNDLGWIVVNNSHVVFAIDLGTRRWAALRTSPRRGISISSRTKKPM